VQSHIIKVTAFTIIRKRAKAHDEGGGGERITGRSQDSPRYIETDDHISFLSMAQMNYENKGTA